MPFKPVTESHTTVKDAIGESNVFLEFQERVSRVASVDRPVLLIGERGTGKELAAARLHYLSHRWESPFIALNCAALSQTLIESELFGYEPGAFTGASGRRIGRFEAADGGSLFLDEIALIPISVQEKILRAVEYGTFERVGGSQPVHVDVRIIGASNTDLKALSTTGRFKRDLLDRLSFDVLFVPPLRVRDGDIILLAQYFAAKMAAELGRDTLPVFSDAARNALESFAWPGNVRELKNVVERAVYRSESTVIDAIDFDPFHCPYPILSDDTRSALCDASTTTTAGAESQPTLTPAEPPAEPTPKIPALPPIDTPFSEAVREYEIALIERALQLATFNQRKAAGILGLTYHQFRGVYRKYSDELAQARNRVFYP